MRVKSVSELCGNEILAEPVLTDEKMILISRAVSYTHLTLPTN